MQKKHGDSLNSHKIDSPLVFGAGVECVQLLGYAGWVKQQQQEYKIPVLLVRLPWTSKVSYKAFQETKINIKPDISVHKQCVIIVKLHSSEAYYTN